MASSCCGEAHEKSVLDEGRRHSRAVSPLVPPPPAALAVMLFRCMPLRSATHGEQNELRRVVGGDAARCLRQERATTAHGSLRRARCAAHATTMQGGAACPPPSRAPPCWGTCSRRFPSHRTSNHTSWARRLQDQWSRQFSEWAGRRERCRQRRRRLRAAGAPAAAPPPRAAASSDPSASSAIRALLRGILWRSSPKGGGGCPRAQPERARFARGEQGQWAAPGGARARCDWATGCKAVLKAAYLLLRSRAVPATTAGHGFPGLQRNLRMASTHNCESKVAARSSTDQWAAWLPPELPGAANRPSRRPPLPPIYFICPSTWTTAARHLHPRRRMHTLQIHFLSLPPQLSGA